MSLSAPVKDIAKNAISVMSQSAFGSILGPVVGGELCDLFGLGTHDKVEDYLKSIMDKLDGLSDQIKALQAAVAQIAGALVKIEEQIDDNELQNLLQAFSGAADIINVAFSSYKSCIDSFTSADSGIKTEAATDLFNLMQFEKSSELAQALMALCECVIPSESQRKGLLELQNVYITDAIIADGASFDAFLPLPSTQNLSGDPSNYTLPITAPDGRTGQYDGLGMHMHALSAATSALNGPVLETLRSFITLATRALVLLNLAWLGTDQEESLGERLETVDDCLRAILTFGGAVPDAVDSATAQNMTTHCKPLPDAVITGLWWDGQGDSYPFSPEWVQWQPYRTRYDDMILAFRPWTFEGASDARIIGQNDGEGSVNGTGGPWQGTAVFRGEPIWQTAGRYALGDAPAFSAFLDPLKKLDAAPSG